MSLWAVWEANHNPPRLFVSEEDARRYRHERVSRSRGHGAQVFIQRIIVTEGSAQNAGV